MCDVVAIVGPTATGKSGLALRLAPGLGAEIVNADALQVYRGLDIGTAKPSMAERLLVRHHLLDVLDPGERFSAGLFSRLAGASLERLRTDRRSALVVGGSGLYLRALFEGISEIPETPPAVRESLRARLEIEGLDALRAELRRVDPTTDARLARGDTQRILRALEVATATGVPLSAWLARKPPKQSQFTPRKLGLTLSRALLYDRIRARVESMLESGWLREVEFLLSQGYSGEEPAFQAIGYRQLVRHLRGEVSLGDAVEETIRATRQYAKRQLTWFRKDQSVRWFDATEAGALESEVRAWLVT